MQSRSRSPRRAPTGAGARSTRARARRPLPLPATALLPLALLAGCSGSHASSADTSGGAPSPSASATARYATLPDPCRAITSGTLKALVPGTKKPKGTEAGSGQPHQHGGCSWNGLHGYQYRYLDDAFQRFDPVAGAPSADRQAATAYTAAVRTAQTASKSAKGTPHTSRPHGLGDQATLITWDTSKDHATYHNATVVVRSANAVLTVDYSAAGLQGAHGPKSSDLRDDAERAARDALSALH